MPKGYPLVAERYFPPRPCAATCGEEFLPKSPRQKYCKVCVPHKSARHRFERYGVSHTQWLATVASQGGLCAICEQPKDLNQDHNHVTGQARGALCHYCNVRLESMETEKWKASAEAYLAAWANA